MDSKTLIFSTIYRFQSKFRKLKIIINMKISITLVLLLSLNLLASAQDLSGIINIIGGGGGAVVNPQPIVSPPQTITPTVSSGGCNQNSCGYHWIFALDESGSMNGIQWTKLKTLMTNIAALLGSVGGQKLTAYTFDTRATLPPSQYIEFANPYSWNSNVLPFSPAGGTDFGQPLIRGLEFILLHRDINTCFVMVTDGQASYPTFEISLFLATRNYMTSRGYKFCSLCYFIKANTFDVIPSAYSNLCKAIGSSTPTGYYTAFKQTTGGAGNLQVASDQSVLEVQGDNLDDQIIKSFSQAVTQQTGVSV